MKEPVKVGFAQTARGGEVAQRGLPRMIFIQVTNHIGDTRVIIHAGILAEKADEPTRFLLRFSLRARMADGWKERGHLFWPENSRR